MQTVKTLLRLWRLYAKMDFDWFVQDMRNCLLIIFCDFITAAAGIAGILVLAVRFGGVGGLSSDEILWMLGFFTLCEGVVNMCFNFNIAEISRRIGRGQLDHMLVMPRPLWMQILTEGFIPVSGNAGVISGIIIMVIASARMGAPFTALHALAVLAYVAARTVLVLSLSYAASTAAFYAPAACEEISSAVFSLIGCVGRYPLSGLPRAALLFLSTALPVALCGYIPSLILLRKAQSALYFILPFAASAGFATLAVSLFKRGLKHYGTTGSVRYRAIGHRR